MHILNPRATTKKIKHKKMFKIIKGIKILHWKIFTQCKRSQWKRKTGTRKTWDINKKKDGRCNPTMSIIILNMNAVNNTIKKQRLSDWKNNKIQLDAIYWTHDKNSQ